jgi:prepilin-type processing-associated H-X9-DG protein
LGAISQAVSVLTVCHPVRDILAVRVESPLLEKGRLSVSLVFPYGSTGWRNSSDWSSPGHHKTQSQIDNGKAEFIRILDYDRYYVRLLSPTKGHSFKISYFNQEWIDSPPARHDGGTTIAYADNHTEYRKWAGIDTVTFGEFGTSGSPSNSDGSQDCRDMRRDIWGKLP